jgi:hypothetical protein
LGQALRVTELPLMGQPFRQLAHFGLGQVYEQLGEIELGIDIMPAAGTSQTG